MLSASGTLKFYNLCKGVNYMVDYETIKLMLEKAGAFPFYFGGDNESYFWRVAEIEGEIFAERAQLVDDEEYRSYYCCLANNKEARLSIYDDMVVDFVVHYGEIWRHHVPTDVFEETAGTEDRGLREILDVFHKKYSDFLNDVMLWFSVLIESEPDDDGVYYLFEPSSLNLNARTAKKVLDRLFFANPIVIVVGDVEYLWQMMLAHDTIWFLKSTRYYRDEYVYISDEYGSVPLKDEDAFNALRDSVRSCFFIEGWKIIDTDTDVDEMLALVNLSLEELEA